MRRKEVFCWRESWRPGDTSIQPRDGHAPYFADQSKPIRVSAHICEYLRIYDVCFQEQVVTNTELNAEEMQTIIGSLQRVVKPRDGANKDAQGVGAESVVASVAPSKLSGLCASLA